MVDEEELEALYEELEVSAKKIERLQNYLSKYKDILSPQDHLFHAYLEMYPNSSVQKAAAFSLGIANMLATRKILISENEAVSLLTVTIAPLSLEFVR